MDAHCQNFVGLKLWVGNIRLDLLDDRHRDVVLVKGAQALEEVRLHQHLLAGLHAQACSAAPQTKASLLPVRDQPSLLLQPRA